MNATIIESAPRFLIVNADDFGLSDGVNRGIIAAHERGIVTSASLMVRWPAARAAAAYAAAHESLSVGLHIDLGEWAYRDGDWLALYQVVPVNDALAVDAEIQRQLAQFEALTGRKPTHLDTHQHVHLREPAKSLVMAAARSLAIPARHYTPSIRYCGEFYGQTGEGEALQDAISVARLLALIDRLSPGWTELACHPGHAGDLDTMYRDERTAELEVLCDPRVKEALASRKVVLRGFRDAPADAVAIAAGTAA